MPFAGIGIDEMLLSEHAESEDGTAVESAEPDLPGPDAYLNAGAAATPDTLKQHVRDNLANYKVPREITILDELPRSITGKISRKELQDRSGKA